MEQEKEILDLRVEYDLDDPHFIIRFSPTIGSEKRESKTTRVTIKFLDVLLEEFAKIYKFYEKVRSKLDLREASITRITDSERDILSMIPGDTTIEKLKTIGKKVHGLLPTSLKRDLEYYSVSCITINSKRFLIPFELMYYGDSFLATRIEFYRKPILMERESPSISPKAKDQPGTIVFCTNPTKDLKAAEQEVSQIINFFRSKKSLNLEIKEFYQDGASYNALANIFPNDRLDIFHYSGHSQITKKDIYFKLADSPLSVTEVVLHYPALFFLNMCEADITVQYKVVFEGYKSLNFPMAIMKQGAKACIATFWPIVDKSAAKFAIEFYNQVIEGESFGKALCYTKKKLSETSDPDDITWMSFVLYGDPSKCLLEGTIKKTEVEILQVHPKKAPFRGKMVKKSDIEILKTLQDEMKTIVNSVEVNSEGFVSFLDLSSTPLIKFPRSISSFPYLMEINFSENSFNKDREVNILVYNGIEVKINGLAYREGQIEAREENQKTFKNAKALFDEDKWEEALDLFKRSMEICIQYQWSDNAKKVKSLILRTEKLIESKITFNQAKYKFSQAQWDEAIELYKKSMEIYKELELADSVKRAEEMIMKAEMRKKDELKHVAGKIMEAEMRKKVEVKRDIEMAVRPEERKKQIVKFRGTKIFQIESQVLQELEKITNKEFKLVNPVHHTGPLVFNVEDNYISEIGIYASIKTLPESIGDLDNLRFLDIQWNHELISLPESLGNLSSLRSLYLGGNMLTDLPDSIGNLKSLTFLKLTNNKLTTLPESLGNLSSLRSLYLRDNMLTDLPDSIGNLKSLTFLKLTNNKLTTLPESLSNLSSLRSLYLGGNMLTELPESIDNLKNLSFLKLRNNKLKSLPDSIYNLPSLKYFDIGNDRDKKEGNEISSIPKLIGNLSLLRELNLDRNKLKTLPKSILNLEYLSNVSLVDNPLVYKRLDSTIISLQEKLKNNLVLTRSLILNISPN